MIVKLQTGHVQFQFLFGGPVGVAEDSDVGFESPSGCFLRDCVCLNHRTFDAI